MSQDKQSIKDFYDTFTSNQTNIGVSVRHRLILKKLKSIGLAPGMIITKVNNEPIETVEQLTGKLNGVNKGVLLEVLSESGKKEYFGFGL